MRETYSFADDGDCVADSTAGYGSEATEENAILPVT